MSDATTCEYEFDPGKHNHTSSPHVLRDILNDREVWSCPHPTYKNEDKCIFHTPEIHDSDAARELLLHQLDKNDSYREVHRFIGAKVDELSLDRTVIDARRVYALDLRFADIGTLDLEHAQISIPIDLTGSNIGKLNCHNADIRSRLECKDAVISHCRGESATFHDRTLFEGTQFKRANFFNVTFEERALFSKSKFGGYTIFRNSDFHHMADFSETTWENQSSFASTKFHEQTDFTDITIHGELSITESMFESKCRLKPQLPQDNSTVLIDLTGTTITTGELANPGTNRLQYDLTEATLGDVELAGENPINFADYQIINTSFDGFEFARYTDSLLAVNWYIHTSKTPPTIDSGSRSPSTIRQRVHQFYLRLKWIANMARRDEYSPGILRSTYLRAKNGAAIVGDDTAMAEFFLREMKYKRKSHFQKFLDSSSLIGLKDWALNWFYNLTAGYGERPWRTLFWSIFIVVLFANMYAFLSSRPYSLSVVHNYLGFSFQAFVALVLGQPQGGQFPGIAAFEAFIGAFMIALFVFTLTRSMHR